MADIEEVKTLFAETQKIATAARDKADELAKKQGDYIDQETLGRIKAELATKLDATDKASMELKSRLDALETKGNRPGKPDGMTPEAKAMDAYFRKGVELPEEIKAMATSSNPDGGYLVRDTMRDGIQKRLRRSSPVRQVAAVVATSGGSYDVLVERGDAGFQWAGESEARSETTTPTINRISIALHELSAMPKATQRLLDDAAFDVEAWLTGYVADRFARAEATAFVSGSGSNQPKGFLSYSKATGADDSRASEALQYRVTGASGAFAGSPNAADALVRLFYDLQGAYQANASWMMKNTTMAEVAVLKDGDGAFLLREMLNGDGSLVRTVQGRPAYVADDMPAIGADSFSIAVGDFSAGYTIVDGQNVTVLRDPFSAKPNVLFYTTKRVGGGVTDFDAIKLLKFGTA
ncbi:phage major capsid protein [Gemmobacter denitrificans]|uniref:Phage major capsid protein n=1 Tax=Gemmobacter denitrificans TaxID=3123040 RepID=A0ABU8BQY4_9RHOB